MDMRIFVLFMLICTQLSNAENPGLKVRISQKGLDYVNGEITRILTKKVLGRVIVPNYELLSLYLLTYSTRLSVKHLDLSDSRLYVSSDQTITFEISNIHIGLQCQLWVKGYSYIFRDMQVSTAFPLYADGLDLSLTATVKMSGGRPRIRAIHCQANVRGLKIIDSLNVPQILKVCIKYVYNYFTSLAPRMISSTICDKVTEVINDNAVKELATLDMTVPIGGDVILNYSLVDQPKFTESYIESSHKAEVTWKNDRTPSNATAPPFPDTSYSNKMISFWLSDYLMNTLGEVTYRHGVLKKNLTARDLGENERWLKTSCPRSYCIGTVITKLAEKFPDTSVALEMSVSKSPRLIIKENALDGQFAGIVKYNVLLPDGSFKYVMTTELTLNVTLNVTLTGTNLTAAIIDHGLLINVSDMIEDLGYYKWISTMKLFPICEAFIRGYIIPKCNELGAKGFPLPKVADVKYINPSLIIEKGVLGIMTDVEHDPS